MSEDALAPASRSALRGALAWSGLSTIILRLGNLLTGIVLARLLAPEVFGVFAVGLTIQSVLSSVADLGLSADLVRARNPRRREPTVATLSVLFGLMLAALMFLTAGPMAALLGTSRATSIIQVLSFTLVLAGLGSVPFARLTRDFAQRRLFAASVASFLVSVTVTLGGVVLGWGAMALAVAQVLAQGTQVAMQFIFTRAPLRFGFDRAIAREAIGFGASITGANLISMAVLTVDNMIVGHRLGPEQLGFYVLAFNISNWPMSAMSQMLRSVAFPGFSRITDPLAVRVAFATAAKVTWSVAVPLALGLALFAEPLVRVVYGTKWEASAAPLYGLATFAGLRIVFDLVASLLYAKGDSRSVLYTQGAWIVVLAPVLWLAVGADGLRGAGWSHTVLALVLVTPAYGWALHRQGISLRDWLVPAGRSVAAGAVASVPTLLMFSAGWSALPTLIAGGLSMAALYSAVMLPGLLPILRGGLQRDGNRDTDPGSSAQTPDIS